MTLLLHYPDGKTVEDEKQPYNTHVCFPCYEKHFEQSYNNPERKHGEPITALAKKFVAEKLTIPFPTEIIS